MSLPIKVVCMGSMTNLVLLCFKIYVAATILQMSTHNFDR